MTSPRDKARRIVLTSVHTSPVASPGAADAGGMNVVMDQTARALAGAGHRVDLVTRRDHPGQPYMVELAENLRLFNLPAGPAETVAKSQAEDLIDEFTRAFDRWWASEGAGVELIHAHHWFAGVAAQPVARAHRVPLVFSYHSVAAPVGADLSAGEQPESAGRPAGERQMAHEADALLAVSQAEKSTIIERYDADPQRICVVHPGVDVGLFRPLRPSEVRWSGECYLFFAARLQPGKDPELAIRTLAAIEKARRMRLVIAGETSADYADYRDSLERLAEDLGVRDDVLFLGSRERSEFAAMMRGACALLNPSLSETYGIVNLEAAASGVPVIATATGGMHESVIDGETGVLLESRDPADWAKWAVQFQTDADLRANIGRAGREFAMTRSWDLVAAETLAFYQAVTDHA